MAFIKNFIEDDEKRIMLFLALSFISLILSFFKIVDIRPDIAWIAIILCGLPIIKGAIIGLVKEFDIKADVLVSLALVAAVIIGEIFAAGEIAFIMALGAMLEERTVSKARAGIEKLVHLTPRTARVVRDGQEHVIPAEDVNVGDTLRVLAGETIAVDGTIISGQTSVDQSVMTGESLPVDKSRGDEVFSGTVNQFGAFDMLAVKVGENSSIQRMIRLVESADAGKAKIVGMADRWATWIVVIALVSAAGTWFFTGEIIRAVTILVVFCPCALVLATPTAIMAGIGNATKYGILIREGDALERLAKVSKIAFDKTGTLTFGKPEVTYAKSYQEGLSDEGLLRFTAAAEQRSEHPLGKAVTAHYKKVSASVLPQPDEFLLKAGRGVKAVIEGSYILAGNVDMMADNGIKLPEEVLNDAAKHRNEGCTVIYIAKDGKTVGFVALSDVIRPETREIIRKLRGINIESVLLTGDHMHAANFIAREAGINNVKFDCLPEDKMAAIDKYQKDNDMVCMVGDGINDAPALKKAHVGVAMGGIGSDIAVDAADIALVGDDIKNIPHLMKLAKRTMGTIKLNLTLSMLLNFIAIILAMNGTLNPIMGALVHNVGSVAVILNSAVLLKFRSA
ncbi:MAG: heavy metal translocating P-type ATPase [Deferribacterales bacterium]